MLDLHCHILPGLDDGAPDLETAIEMAKIAVEDGIDTIVATPHFLEGSMENCKQQILQKVSEFQKALEAEGILLKVLPGAEVYISPITPRLLMNDEIITINHKGKHLLVELPMQNVPDFVKQVLFELKVNGVTPIIAHPERNLEMSSKPEMILELASEGCLLQINAGSITGLYGEKVRTTAQLLVRNGLVHLIGSDAHSTGGRSPRILKALKIAERLNPGIMEEIFSYSKKVLIGDEVAVKVPSVIKRDRSGLWERLKRVL